MKSLPPNWKATTSQCNFFMARREIADFLRLSQRRARDENKDAFYQTSFVEGWTQFAADPCFETAVRFMEGAPEYAPGMFEYFLGCCPGGALHRPAFGTATSFSVGDYNLKRRIEDIKGLKELSEREYAFFPKQFKGEAIYNATPIDYLGRTWKIMVSSVQGQLYKWAASLEVKGGEDAEEIAGTVFRYCEQSLGTPSQESQGLMKWDTTDGNVILQLTPVMDQFDISIFATARAIRNLPRL